MIKKAITIVSTAALLSVSANAYNEAKANQLSDFYSHMTQQACADSKLFVEAEDVMKMFREKKSFTLLDVRTAGENGIVALSSSNAIHVPVEALFKKENLDKLPTDQPVIVTCHSGIRATMIAMGLKQIGFTNIHVLKGGVVALADATTPKNVPIK